MVFRRRIKTLKPPAFSRILVTLVGPGGAGALAGGAGMAAGLVSAGALAGGTGTAAGLVIAGAAAGPWARVLVQWERKMSRSVSEKRG